MGWGRSRLYASGGDTANVATGLAGVPDRVRIWDVIDANLAQRARNAILAAALGDLEQSRRATAGQPVLFQQPPRLSDDIWLMLSTCESIARAGGRAGADILAAVAREWRSAKRLPAVSSDAAPPDATLRVAPLAFVLDLDDLEDQQLLRDAVRMTHPSEDAWMAAGMAVRLIRDGLLAPSPSFWRSAQGEALADLPIARALRLAARYPDDLQAALTAVDESADDGVSAPVAALTGMLLGAAGCEIPHELIVGIAERAEVEAVVEPFAQLVAAVAT